MEKHRILIIEDEKLIARFLELELSHEGYEIDIERDGREGLQKVRDQSYHLVLLDIMLPGINGMEVCRRIRQFSNVPVIMVTAKDEVTSKVMGLDLGADDYITKPFAIEELLARIRAVFRRKNEVTASSKTLQIHDLIMDLTSHLVKRGGQPVELTKKEYDLLELLMRNKDIVLSREQILEKVWGYEFSGDTNVVDVYIKYLRSKIDEAYETKFIHTIRGVGYVLRVTGDDSV
jgi:two-component system, OmpR family, response regulator ArlR